jgi:hypothetical protein
MFLIVIHKYSNGGYLFTGVVLLQGGKASRKLTAYTCL